MENIFFDLEIAYDAYLRRRALKAENGEKSYGG